MATRGQELVDKLNKILDLAHKEASKADESTAAGSTAKSALRGMVVVPRQLTADIQEYLSLLVPYVNIDPKNTPADMLDGINKSKSFIAELSMNLDANKLIILRDFLSFMQSWFEKVQKLHPEVQDPRLLIKNIHEEFIRERNLKKELYDSAEQQKERIAQTNDITKRSIKKIATGSDEDSEKLIDFLLNSDDVERDIKDMKGILLNDEKTDLRKTLLNIKQLEGLTKARPGEEKKLQDLEAQLSRKKPTPTLGMMAKLHILNAKAKSRSATADDKKFLLILEYLIFIHNKYINLGNYQTAEANSSATKQTGKYKF